MKRLTFATGVVLCAIVLASGAAMAKSGDRDPIRFETLDTDGDGRITRDEMANLRARQIAETDADGDGSVSLEELEAHAVERSKDRAKRMMERLDADGDGVLSAEEMKGGKRAERRFDRIDSDGDGAITKAEFDAARDRMGKRRPATD